MPHKNALKYFRKRAWRVWVLWYFPGIHSVILTARVPKGTTKGFCWTCRSLFRKILAKVAIVSVLQNTTEDIFGEGKIISRLTVLTFCNHQQDTQTLQWKSRSAKILFTHPYSKKHQCVRLQTYLQFLGLKLFRKALRTISKQKIVLLLKNWILTFFLLIPMNKIQCAYHRRRGIN